MKRKLILAGAASFCLVAFNTARAQRMRGADTLSPKAIADSQAVIAQMVAKTKADRRDTASMFRTGVAAWALYERARAANPPRGLDATRLGRMADTSLRIAADLAPNDVIYQLTAADFLIASGVPSARTAAGKYYQSGLDAARKSDNAELRSRAALEYGRVAWRRYDNLVNRRMNTNGVDVGRSLSDAMQPIAKGAAQMEELAARDREAKMLQLLAKASGQGAKFVAAVSLAQMHETLMRAGMSASNVVSGRNVSASQSSAKDNPGISLGSVRNIIETQTFALPGNVSGAGDFERADTLFNEAYKADPTSLAAFRAVAMWLCEKKEWGRLEALAREHIGLNRSQGLGWQALGLALHRQGKSLAASQVFDTSMMAFGPDELRRLDSPSRTMPPSRASRIDAAWATNRAAISNILWQSADPMWSDGLAERRAEFRARVAYAEIRWTVEEANIKGASTDRGDIFIRYGPPDLIAVFGPTVMDYAQDIMTFWIYDSGLMFAFTSYAGFGTSRIPPTDRAMVDAHVESQPARWDNLGDVRPDSMIMRIARFRGAGDSLDVFVAALPPTDAIRESTPSKEVRGDVWLMAANGEMAYHTATILESSGVHAWAARVSPGGYAFRVEATGREANRSARVSGQVGSGADFPMTGLGMSDLVIASSAVEPVKPGTRWRDLSVVPSVGAVVKGSPIALIWENYRLASTGGTTRYDVTVSIISQKTTAAKIVAAIKGALASVAKVDTREDRTVIQYDRNVPAAPIITEVMSIDFGDTPEGTYTVIVDVTDKANGLKLSRSTTVIIKG